MTFTWSRLKVGDEKLSVLLRSTMDPWYVMEILFKTL
jgi:hypothetical protein